MQSGIRYVVRLELLQAPVGDVVVAVAGFVEDEKRHLLIRVNR